MPINPPLHECSPLTRFADRARDYAAFRPGYPAAAIDEILLALGDPESLSCADIGAGTGISSRAFADRGVRVFAIEPNADMRAQATPYESVTFLDATAENTGLADSSVDFVTCFQSFHWFKQELALREFYRILRRGGRLALCWNERDGRDPFTAEYGKLILEVCGEHPGTRRDEMALHKKMVESTGLFRNVRLLETPNSRRSTLEALLGACRSGSYVPLEGPGYERLMSGLTELHEKYRDAEGCITMVYRTEVLLAEPV